jgi:hypothetical protein
MYCWIKVGYFFGDPLTLTDIQRHEILIFVYEKKFEVNFIAQQIGCPELESVFMDRILLFLSFDRNISHFPVSVPIQKFLRQLGSGHVRKHRFTVAQNLIGIPLKTCEVRQLSIVLRSIHFMDLNIMKWF